jgi:hypothetical protein
VGKHITVREVDQAINRELPLGSTKGQVVEFLDKKHIQHSELVVVRYDSDYPDNLEKRLINAAIPKVKTRLLVEWGIYITFRFDEADRLIDHRVKWVGTGP